MGKIFTVIFLVMFINATSAEVKVGFVEISKILKGAPQTAVSNKKLEKEFKGRTDKLKKTIVSLQNKGQKYKKNNLTMDDETRVKVQRELQLAKIDIQRDERELKEDINIRRREEMNALQAKVTTAISIFAQANKYDLILYQGVAYTSEAIDVTDEIIKEMGITRPQVKK
jgi:outer membrane protein